MKRSNVIAGAVAAAVIITGVAVYSFKDSDTRDKSEVIATFNGGKVTKKEAEDVLANALGGMPKFADKRFDDLSSFMQQNIVREVVVQRLVNAKAKKSGVAKQPNTKQKISAVTDQLVREAFLQHIAEDEVTEAAIKDQYDQMANALEGKEQIRARHILVKTETEAKNIAKKIARKHITFEEAAKEHSLDSSKQKGGDLGYFSEGQMVEPFQNAAFALKKGDISQPVETQFGWHIIKLEDRREIEVPSFDEAKEAIKQELYQQAIQSYIKDVVDSIDLVMLGEEAENNDAEELAEASE